MEILIVWKCSWSMEQTLKSEEILCMTTSAALLWSLLLLVEMLKCWGSWLKHVSKAGKVNPHQGNHFTGATLSPCKQAFNNNAKPPPKRILREFDVSRIGPRLGGLPHLERLHSKIWPRVRRLPGLADRATRLCGSPHLPCKRDQIKMRDYMDRRATSLPKFNFWS